MKSKTFERTLPEGYSEIMTVDAKNTKLAVVMNIVAAIVTAIVMIIAFAIVKPTDFMGNYSFARNIIFILALFLYIVLHEITHGAAYKLLTGEKLTFGMTISVAYCGVPDIYVYRRTALISLLAPFVLFSAVFGVLVLVLPNAWDKIYASFLLGMHLGGCSGDLYDTILFMTKLRDPMILMNDTGPKQTFYKKN